MKEYKTNRRTIRNIILDYALSSKVFMRFLKENGCFNRFFNDVRQLLLFHRFDDTHAVRFNEKCILRDAIFYSIPLTNGWERIDQKWLCIFGKDDNVYHQHKEEELERLLEIAEKKYGLCRLQ